MYCGCFILLSAGVQHRSDEFSISSLHGQVHVSVMEGNVLFNDALNTFYLRLYGIRNMVKDHSDSERGNPLLFPISSNNTYHSLCYTSPGALA